MEDITADSARYSLFLVRHSNWRMEPENEYACHCSACVAAREIARGIEADPVWIKTYREFLDSVNMP